MASSTWLVVLAIGAALRFWLMSSPLSAILNKTSEVSTPLNSWMRVTEGVFMYHRGIDPYSGSVFHETPLALIFFDYMIHNWSRWLPALFVVCDLLTAVVLSEVGNHYARAVLVTQSLEVKTYAADVGSILARGPKMRPVPFYVLLMYLFNPYSVVNCVGMTTTVFSNLFLALTALFAVKGYRLGAALTLALASYQSLYPAMLLVPVAIAIAQADTPRLCFADVSTWVSFGKTASVFATCLAVLLVVSSEVCHGWNFVRAVYGCILIVPELNPNIGLFWYFFVEMFDHFRAFFICTFQLNAFIYVVPLTTRLHKDPLLLFFCLSCAMTVFKSYPSVGDVALYMAFLPMWLHLYRFMRQSFIIGGFFLACSVLGPITRHLWLYAGSANANFYFAMTLAFATGQIFLMTDVLFAYVKRDFHLHHGMKPKIDGEDAKIVLN